MKTLLRIMLCIVVVCLLSPMSGMASPVEYSLAGSVWDLPYSAAIWGSITVNDTLSTANRDRYAITSFSINSPGFTFTGNSGDLWFYKDPVTSRVGPTEWWLNGTFTWAGGSQKWNWDGASFYMLTPDGKYNYDANAYDQLQPKIALDDLNHLVFPWLMPGDHPGGKAYQGSTIVAYLSEASVPEPSTFLSVLCGFLLLGVVGWRVGCA